MGHVYALGGPSGVGKTTFLESLFSIPQGGLTLLPRATGRIPRPGERDGFDYTFYSSSGFLQKIFANDFVHVEQFGSSFFGIEASPIEEAIQAEHDAIIMSGIYGAARLKQVYGANVSVMCMFTGTRRSLMSPDTLTLTGPDIKELERRLRKKIREGVIEVPESQLEAYVQSRMHLNIISLAYTNGRLRSGDEILVLENLRDRLADALAQFAELRQRTSGVIVERFAKRNICFVLMPFKQELTFVYDDHIASVIRRLGLQPSRADRIFSNRPIMADVLDSVRNARIVISDLTHANPNVLYETGMCHALGKEVVLITQESTAPFDLGHIRQIRYSQTPRGMREFEAALEETIKAILVR